MVINKFNFIGICQRDIYNYYAFLFEMKSCLKDSIFKLFENVKDNFPDNDCIPILTIVTFDVYIDNSNSECLIIDFNPFTQSTDSLLFDWEEIYLLKENSTIFKLVENQLMANSASNSLSSNYYLNKIPQDLLSLSNGSNSAEYLENIIREMQTAIKSEDIE